MRSARRLATTAALALTLGAGLLAVVPAASYAAKVTVSDPVGDPVKSVGESSALMPAPRSAAVDIVRTTIDYRRDVLVVRTKAVRAANKDMTQIVRVRSGGEDAFFFGLSAADGSFDEDGCDGASLTINKATATYTLKVAARCFGSPRTIRVGSGLSRLNVSPDGDVITADDDAQMDGADPQGTYKLGRAIRRG